MRKYNFSAGPSTLPFEVLEVLEKEIKNFHDSGFSLIEASHRGKEYDSVHSDAIALLKETLAVPDGYSVLFLGGGATLQFGMVPMNFLPPEGKAGYTLTGAWAQKAYNDGIKVGKAEIVYDGRVSKFSKIPSSISESGTDYSYLHITSNETINGVQWNSFPKVSAPLIADMSSDICSRPIPVDRFSLIYAGAQKNLGPAGVTVVIIKDEMLEKCNAMLPVYLNYSVHAEKNSLYNTPPVFSVWALSLVLEWIKENGGLTAIEEKNNKKAKLIYDIIDANPGFYKSSIDKESRSKMNIVFTLPDDDLTASFLEKTVAADMMGLKGHRSVGGIRVSLYNAMPVQGAERLAEVMNDFVAKNG